MIDTGLFEAKKLYPFQEKTVATIIEELDKNGSDFNLLFQLPTGGGKTVIFSEVAKKFIEKYNKKVLILTHRIELSVQTSKQLSAIGIGNKIINWEQVACTYLFPNEDRVHIYFQTYQDIPDLDKDHEPVYKRRPDWILTGKPAKDLKDWIEKLGSQTGMHRINDPHDP